MLDDRAPMYFDACREWYDRLSTDDKELMLTLTDIVGSAHKGSAERHSRRAAAALPPAPQRSQ